MSTIFQKPPFNFQYQVGLTNLVDVSGDAVVRSGVTVDSLIRTLVIKGGAFALDGQKAKLILAGTKTQPDNTIRFLIRANGIDIWDLTAGVNGATRAWIIRTELMRLGFSLACYTEMFPSMPENSTVEEQQQPFVTRVLVSPVNFALDTTMEFRITINGAGDSFNNNFAHLKIE